jgi:hypothetical protein
VALKVSALIVWIARLAGICAGAILGFYLPMSFMVAFLEIGYEQALPWLLLSAVVGLFAGGLALADCSKCNASADACQPNAPSGMHNSFPCLPPPPSHTIIRPHPLKETAIVERILSVLIRVGRATD